MKPTATPANEAPSTSACSCRCCACCSSAPYVVAALREDTGAAGGDSMEELLSEKVLNYAVRAAA
ncbi:hypothetical protein [Streptomyces sp. NPDC001020]